MSRKKGQRSKHGKRKSKGSTTSMLHCTLPERPRPEEAPAISLVDEARWMACHRTAAFNAGKKLRHLPVQFVSAGHLHGTLPPTPANLTETPSNNFSIPFSPSSMRDNTDAMARMALRSQSPVTSEASSSSDEVVFRGRGQPSAAPDFPSPKSDERASPGAMPSATAPSAPSAEPASEEDCVVEESFTMRRGERPSWEGTTTEWKHRSKPDIGWLPIEDRSCMDVSLPANINVKDLAVHDYMQNVEDLGLPCDRLGAATFARRELDLDASSHNDWGSVSVSQSDKEEDKQDDVAANFHWDSDMLQDVDNLSTSSDVTDTVVRILSKRTRRSGLQYLCVYEGSVSDDAHWLPVTYLRSDAEKKLIEYFEEDSYLREVSPDDNDSIDMEADVVGDVEIDDETIARVLQKQEELGLGSDELFFYGTDESFDTTTGIPYTHYGSSKNSLHIRRRSTNVASFPSASAMADALSMDPYGGFDIMDTERPSLKIKKKARRGRVPPELENDYISEQLQRAWEADRTKKRLKKAEREELRQQGMLGRKGKAANLNAKYKRGFCMEDVVDEIREFLFSDRQSLSLPPMDAHHRATIHQAAKYVNLSSKSRGDGQNRFTVLSRTSSTRTYTNDEFELLVRRHGFLKRLHGPIRGKQRLGSVDYTRYRSGAHAQPHVHYRDGEQVGANAPELGPENKGHALLTKMGWSKGMALGTMDNQGILHPITHTVKTNRAGLQ